MVIAVAIVIPGAVMTVIQVIMMLVGLGSKVAGLGIMMAMATMVMMMMRSDPDHQMQPHGCSAQRDRESERERMLMMMMMLTLICQKCTCFTPVCCAGCSTLDLHSVS